MFNSYFLSRREGHSYEFVTDFGIKYRAYFIEAGFSFEGFSFMEQFVYIFNIKVLSGNAAENGPDPRIPDTIFKVFVDFIMSDERRAIIYICDASDSRELARKRKFDQWFEKYNRVLFAKCDCIAVFKDQKVHHAMVVRMDSRFWEVYLAMYHQLNSVIGIKDDEECAA